LGEVFLGGVSDCARVRGVFWELQSLIRGGVGVFSFCLFALRFSAGLLNFFSWDFLLLGWLGGICELLASIERRRNSRRLIW
jgi:hypothetical protein